MRAGSIMELWEALAAGIYLSFAYIHLDLWLRRRERLGNLWLAAAAISAMRKELIPGTIRTIETSAPILCL